MSSHQQNLYYLYEVSSKDSILQEEVGCFLFAKNNGEARNRMYVSISDMETLEVNKYNFCLIPYDERVCKVKFRNERDAREASDMIGRIIPSKESINSLNPKENQSQTLVKENNSSNLTEFFSLKKRELSIKLRNSINYSYRLSSEYIHRDDKSQLIFTALEAFNYRGHFYASSISSEKFNTLTNCKSHGKMSNRKLAGIKKQLASNFRQDISNIDTTDYSLDELKNKINSIVTNYLNMSENVRVYSRHHSTEGRYEYVDGYDQEWVEGRSWHTEHTSHETSRFEAYLTNVSTAVDDFEPTVNIENRL